MGQRQLGAVEATAASITYLNLRIGKMAQTSSTPQPGFSPVTTKNKAGEEFHFFAKAFDELYGYVDRIKHYDKTLDNGTKLSGILITLNCGSRTFGLDIGKSDRPYNRLITLLAEVDFDQPVLFRAFMGKDQKPPHSPQKVLLISQEDDAEGKPVWMKAHKYQEKYLSQLLAQKLREGVGLTDDEKRNVAYDAKGKPDNTYPYIVQKRDGKWSFEKWDEFLYDKLLDEIIPACAKAAEERKGEQVFGGEQVHDGGTPETNFDFSGEPDVADESDEIPF